MTRGRSYISDVLGKRVIETSWPAGSRSGRRTQPAALEVMSRFAIDPRWLLYLPPTMAPCATSAQPGLLEHPAEAFAAYAADGIAEVDLRREAHGLAGHRAGLPGRPAGRGGQPVRRGRRQPAAVYTRTGRPFFAARRGPGRCWTRSGPRSPPPGCGQELDTAWLLLDCELMPWSVKAEALLRQQYAAVGAAARAALPAAGRAARPGSGARARRGRAGRPDRGPAGRRGRVHRRLPAVLLAGARAGWVAAGPVPATGHRTGHVLPAGSRLAPGPGRPAGRRGARADPAHPAAAGGQHRPGLGGRRDGLVDRADRGRRRGHGGQAAGQFGTRRARASPARDQGAAGRTTCGSSTARTTRSPGTWTGCRTATWAGSVRWRHESTRWASRRWTGRPAGSRCGGCTRRCSACWPWNRSRSTRGCERSAVRSAGPAGTPAASGAAARSAGRCTARSRRRSGSASEHPGHARTRIALVAAAVS